jgi:hypothetical protein
VTSQLLDFFRALIRPYDYTSESIPSLDHCRRYTANYGPGREPCTAKGFSPGLGVVPGLFFNTVHQTTLPLASPGTLIWFFTISSESWHHFKLYHYKLVYKLVLSFHFF